jgi:hypothetical protein
MAKLEAAKRTREAAETELRGSQMQASIAAATIQALEEEIAKVGSDLEELKGCALEQGRNEFKDKAISTDSFCRISKEELRTVRRW